MLHIFSMYGSTNVYGLGKSLFCRCKDNNPFVFSVNVEILDLEEMLRRLQLLKMAKWSCTQNVLMTKKHISKALSLCIT